jgi:hypothetical protein
MWLPSTSASVIRMILWYRALAMSKDSRSLSSSSRLRPHLVEPRPLHVQDLALERQDGLELPVAALLGRAAGRIALDDEQLAVGRVLLGTVGQLAGQRASVQGALAPDQFLGLAGRFARARRVQRLGDDLAGDRRVFLEIGPQRLVDCRLDDALHLAVAQLGLGLPFELRVAQLDAHDRRQALADVVAGQRLVVLLEQLVGVRVVVDRAGQGRLEADQVRAALARVDVVREGIHVLGVAVVVLEGHFEHDAALLYFNEDRLVERRLGAVQMLHEGDDAALVLEDLLLLLALVLERDFETLVEEGQLAQALGQDVEAVLGRLEDLAVRLEGHHGPAFLRLAGDFERRGRLAPFVPLLEDLAVLPDFQFEPFREGVDDRDADPVQAAGDLVGPLLELAAGVQDGEGDFRGGFLLRRVHARRDAAAVVHDRDAAVDMERDFDRFAEAGHVLVHAVVHDFVDEVVEPVLAGAADVHGGTLADRVEPLQHLDLVRAVAVGHGLVGLLALGLSVLFFRRHSSPCLSLAPCPSPKP